MSSSNKGTIIAASIGAISTVVAAIVSALFTGNPGQKEHDLTSAEMRKASLSKRKPEYLINNYPVGDLLKTLDVKIKKGTRVTIHLDDDGAELAARGQLKIILEKDSRFIIMDDSGGRMLAPDRSPPFEVARRKGADLLIVFEGGALLAVDTSTGAIIFSSRAKEE